MNASRPWYAGRLARRRGTRVDVDVLAVESETGWEPVPNARKLFPKTGQVELLGPSAIEGRAGDWLAFQTIADGRPGTRLVRVGTHRFLWQFADLRALGTVEKARFLFTQEGWDDGGQVGHWAVRFADDRVLALQLNRARNGLLKCAERDLDKINCLPFEESWLLSEPATDDPRLLYDIGEATPLAVYDWSPGADYVAHVVRALAGADDPRLPELITWLELHRDEVTGRISAINADHELAFEALRSGELVARLSADREVMAAYLTAVRDDPAVAAVVERAAVEEVERSREAVRAAIEQELESEIEGRREQIAAQFAGREAALEADLQMRIARHEQELMTALELRMAERGAAASAKADAEEAAVMAAIEAARTELASLRADRDELAGELDALGDEIKRREQAAQVSGERLAALDAELMSAAERGASVTRPIARVAEAGSPSATAIDRAELGRRIASCVLLTANGKDLMAAFAAYLLAGEMPVLDGSQTEDFVLVAEALLAAGRLVPFDADSTVITPEDVWSRPASGIPSQVAQAAVCAAEGRTFLVHLRGIDRSAAGVWYPALISLARRGLLPRRLLLFATITDPMTDQAKSLPGGICRMTIEGAMAEGAALVGPSLLGGAASAIAFHVDPGNRPVDLSSTISLLPALADAGFELNLATAMRAARIAIEAAALAPDDAMTALNAAKRFCQDIHCDAADGTGTEATHA